MTEKRIAALALSTIALLGGCGGEASAPSPPAAETTSAQAAPAAAAPARPGPDLAPERTAGEDHEVIAFHVALDRARVTIADVAMSTDLESVLAKTGGSLAVNAGFFEVDTLPEGLAVSEGRELSAKSLVLGGGVVAIAGRRARLFAVEEYAPPEGLDFAVQCRPRLVVGGAQHVKKDDGRAAERTALCLRDGGARLDVVLARGPSRGDGPTLSAWSALLAARGCEGALNLDGGPSTGAAWREGGSIRSSPPREGIRHAIVVTLD